MITVTSSETFKTSHGMAYIINNPPELKVGQEVKIDGKVHTIKQIVMPSSPSENKSALFV